MHVRVPAADVRVRVRIPRCAENRNVGDVSEGGWVEINREGSRRHLPWGGQIDLHLDRPPGGRVFSGYPESEAGLYRIGRSHASGEQRQQERPCRNAPSYVADGDTNSA
jgi:hypothetical protein